MRDLLDRLAALFASGVRRPPLVAKIAPDIDDAGLDAVLAVLLKHRRANPQQYDPRPARRFEKPAER